MVPFKLPKLNLSIKLLLILVGALLFGNILPESLQSFCYAISLTLKSLLLFVLPVVAFSGIFSCLLNFGGKKAAGFLFVLSLFGIICLSNCFSTFLAYGVGALHLFNLDPQITNATHSALYIEELEPLFTLEFPHWVSNDFALFLGFALGSLFSFFPNTRIHQFSISSKKWVTFFLEKCFIPVLPMFAFGFILKMQHDGILLQTIESYLPLLMVILLTYILYLLLLFWVAANFSLTQFKIYLKNLVPVALMGFSTMSSLATMPVTLSAAEKNTGNVDIPRAVIPTTVNTHMIGVSLAVPLMAFAILDSFGYQFPSFAVYSHFAIYFILAQFAMAGVPGGGIIVMLPVLEMHLGFTGEMSALITALYIMVDPAVTFTNVMGNSALVILVSKIFGKILPKPALA